MQEKVEDQMYTVEGYEIIKGRCEDEGAKELSL